MTKEEILETKNGFFYLEDNVYHEKSVLEAMDDWAKEVNFAFDVWVQKIVDEGGERMEKLKSFSKEELFNQFLSEQSK